MLTDIANVIVALAAFGSLAYSIYSSWSKANNDRVSAIEKKLDGKADVAQIAAALQRVDKVEDRTTRIEAEMRHLPDKEVTHRLEIFMRELKAEVGVLAERLKPVAAISDRLQEFLLEKAERP
ncbi:MAG: DUF2730 family protein [Xanthobacteraceae bacterium]